MLVISLAEDVYMDGEERQDNFPNLGKDNVTKRQSDNVDIPNDISKSIFNEISTSTSNNILIDFSNDNSYSNSNSDVFSTTPSSLISASSDSNSYSSSTPRMSNGISSESPTPGIHYTTNKKTSSPKKRKSGPMISSERNTNSWRSDSIYSENSPTSSSGFFSNSSLNS